MLGLANASDTATSIAVFTVSEKALTALTSTAGPKSLLDGAWTMLLRYVDTTTDTLQLTR